MKDWLKQSLRSLAALAVLGIAGGSARAATPEQVDGAVKKGVAYLYSQIHKDNWEIVDAPKPSGEQADVAGRQWGGITACAVYALLAAGETPSSDPRLAAAIEWLKKAKIEGHYAVGMRAQAWTFLPDKEARLASKADFDILMRSVIMGGKLRGFYPYFIDLKTNKPQAGWADLSVSQISVLGMWACDQAGQEVPISYWQMVDESWRKAQKPDGGWSYRLEEPNSKSTMTAAGVATLFITQDYLLAGRGRAWDRCVQLPRDDAIERGLAWVEKNAGAYLGGDFYGMYAAERIGVASGRKYFGVTDWYKTGSNWLVGAQQPDGSWGGEEPHMNAHKIPATIFSMLFLIRGRAPVLMNKLEYYNGNPPAAVTAAPAPKTTTRPVVAGEPWNQRPRDVANFTHWSHRQTERYLNWQVVNLKASTADDLHDAPILYIAGSEPLKFSDEEVKKLREFAEDGGVILGNADCANEDFSKSFAALARQLFPRYELRSLPPTHPIFNAEQYKAAKWKSMPQVLGLSNGVREMMLLVPGADMGRAWQARAEKTKEESFQLMQNIFLYAADKGNMLARGQTYVVDIDPKIKPTKTVRIARLIAGDNPDPEPGGWRRLAAILNNSYQLGVTVDAVRPGEGKLTGAKIAHLTGTAAFKLNDAAKQEIKSFVAKGGTLIVDAAGGSPEFATSADAELCAIFGGQPGNFGDVLEPENDVYKIPGAKIDRFSYRTFARGRVTGQLNVPRIRAIEQAGRVQVYFSREDISAGLVGQAIDGVNGYDPATATAILRNIILQAAGVKPPPTANAAAK